MDYLTKTITLPVSGLEAVIREADGNAERLLFARQQEMHKALPDYWAKLTVRLGTQEKVAASDVLNLLTPDQEFLAIEIYRLTIGDTLSLTGNCGSCGKSAGYEVDLSKLDRLPLPDGAVGPDPTFEVVLPRTGHRVVFGYLTGKQEQEELEIEGFDPGRMEFKAIRSIDGSTDVKFRLVQAWPLADHKALRAAMRDNRCGYDTRVRFTHSCGKAQVMNILLDPSFLLPGLAA